MTKFKNYSVGEYFDENEIRRHHNQSSLLQGLTGCFSSMRFPELTRYLRDTYA